MIKNRMVSLAAGMVCLASLAGSDVLTLDGMASETAGPGHNLIPGDSSFETGLGAPLTSSCAGTVQFERDAKQSVDGKHSAKLQFSIKDWVRGKPIRAEQGKTYTFSLYAKADREGVKSRLYLIKAADWTGRHGTPFALTTKWKRYFLSVQATEGEYWLGFEAHGPCVAWVDAYQFEEGSEPTPYKNKNPISLGIDIPSNYNYVFFPDEEIKIHFSVYKAWAEAETKDLSLSYQIGDFYGATVKKRERKIALDKERWFEESLLFKPQRLGLYVVRSQIGGPEGLIGTSIVHFAVVEPPVEIEGGKEPFCGICGGGPLPGLRRIGVHWISKGLLWKNIEREKGKFNWSSTDATFRRLKEAGYKIKAFTFNAAPSWTWDPKEVAEAKAKGITLPRWGLLPAKKYLVDWRNFIKQAAIRYGDVIDIWEIGGECDLTVGHHPFYRAKYPETVENNFIVLGPVVDRYAEMIRIAAGEILSNIPDAKVGAIRPSGVDCTSVKPRYTFSKAVFKKCGSAFNLFPLDPYCSPRYIGPGKPLPEVPEDFLIDDFKEALALTKKYGTGQHIYVSEFGWAFDKDIEPDSNYAGEMCKRLARTYLIARMIPKVDYCMWHNANCGGYEAKRYNYGLWHPTRPMATVPVYSAVARIVENVIEAREIDLGTTVKAGVFKKPDRADGAIWHIIGEGKITIIAPESLPVFDVMGNPLGTERHGEKTTFEIGEFPVYLSLEGEASFEKLCKIISEAKLEIVPATVSFTTPRIDKGVVYLQSQAHEDLTAEISFDMAGEVVKRTVKIPAAKRTPVEIPLSGNTAKEEVKVEVDCGKGFNKVSAQFYTEFQRVEKIGSPVKIDGDLSEWKNRPCILMNKRGQILPPDPHVNWSGPEDLSARVYVGWDKDNFYLAAAVTDDKHFGGSAARDICNGDCLHFAFDPLVNGGLKTTAGYDPDDYELATALTSDGPASWQMHGSDKGLRKGSEFAAVRDEAGKKTFYEARIPWKHLGVPAEQGRVFGFNFVIFDDDEGAGHTYHYQLSPGITGGKTPGVFKRFALRE